MSQSFADEIDGPWWRLGQVRAGDGRDAGFRRIRIKVVGTGQARGIVRSRSCSGGSVVRLVRIATGTVECLFELPLLVGVRDRHCLMLRP
jgi:hypothetical protein